MQFCLTLHRCGFNIFTRTPERCISHIINRVLNRERERRNTMIAMLKYVMDMLQILAQGPETEEDGYLEMREEARG
jgi:hypothetical protein